MGRCCLERQGGCSHPRVTAPWRGAPKGAEERGGPLPCRAAAGCPCSLSALRGKMQGLRLGQPLRGFAPHPPRLHVGGCPWPQGHSGPRRTLSTRVGSGYDSDAGLPGRPEADDEHPERAAHALVMQGSPQTRPCRVHGGKPLSGGTGRAEAREGGPRGNPQQGS